VVEEVLVVVEVVVLVKHLAAGANGANQTTDIKNETVFSLAMPPWF
jgi:hypothetical protein